MEVIGKNLADLYGLGVGVFAVQISSTVFFLLLVVMIYDCSPVTLWI